MRIPVALAVEDRLPLGAAALRDYIRCDYPPAAPRRADSLHPAALLRHLLRAADRLDAWPVVEACRALLGPEEVVWGVKLGARFQVELYFYNPTANAPGNPARVDRIAAALAPFGAFPALADESLPYFLVSFEVGLGGFSPWRLYLGTGERGRPPSGFSYRLEALPRFENHYQFYAAADAAQRADALGRIVRAMHARGWDPGALLDCHTVCWAVKPHADGLYFSRLDTETLATGVAGLDEAGAELAAHLRATPGYAPLRWDLGLDFVAGRVVRFAVHGVA